MPYDYHETAIALRNLILSGDLAPGTKIIQTDMAAQLHCSESALHVALTTLLPSGLVLYDGKNGFRIREYSFDQVRHAFTLRAELEAIACHLATPKMTGATEKTLQDIISWGDDLLQKPHSDENEAAYQHMNLAFHTAIIEIAENPWLENFMGQLQNIPLSANRKVIWREHHIMARAHEDHRRIARYLSHGEGQRASTLMREHILYALEILFNSYAEYNIVASSLHDYDL